MYSGQKYLFQPTIINCRSGAPQRPNGRRGACVFARAKTLQQLTIEDCQVGFPIRTSRDQRVLSPPPGLSQSATSFIASCCQGIHQTPLSRLIRSRRRQAPFARAPGRKLKPAAPFCRKSNMTHAASPAKRIRQVKDRNCARRQTRPLGQCLQTWKDCPDCR